MDAAQQKIDQAMIDFDGTDNKSNLGAITILAVSLATAKAYAAANDIDLFDRMKSYEIELEGIKCQCQ